MNNELNRVVCIDQCLVTVWRLSNNQNHVFSKQKRMLWFALLSVFTCDCIKWLVAIFRTRHPTLQYTSKLYIITGFLANINKPTFIASTCPCIDHIHTCTSYYIHKIDHIHFIVTLAVHPLPYSTVRILISVFIISK